MHALLRLRCPAEKQTCAAVLCLDQGAVVIPDDDLHPAEICSLVRRLLDEACQTESAY